MSTVRDTTGFTLIEVIVVVAIVAIMAGIMVPSIWRVWDSQDEETTRQRMRDIKIALVGDGKLIENGVRTHFGYVGDVGQLPSSLENLLVNTDGAANWRGPYLPAGFDPATYGRDAWGGALDYAAAVDGTGRRSSASLQSPGMDGTAGTGDDIADAGLQVAAEEVLPLKAVSGNVSITFQTAPLAVRSFYVGAAIRYRNGAGGLATDVCCDRTQKTITGTAGNVQVNYVQQFSCTPAADLPVGISFLSPGLFTNDSCTAGLGGAPLEVATTVGQRSLFVNLQIQSVP